MADLNLNTSSARAVLDAALNTIYFNFLDSLRRLGITNIRHGVAPHLMLKFSLSREQAAQILGEWARRQEIARG